jgi:putative salt-induced outer membrane protein
MSLRFWIFASISLIPSLVYADPMPSNPTAWTASAELGASMATGNSQNTNVNAKLKIKYHHEPWTNRLRLETLQASENGSSTANRTLADFESHYSLNERNYVFGSTRASRDTFSGYNYQMNAAGGLGHRFWLSDRGSFTLELGPGFRRSQQQAGETHNNLIARTNGDFVYRFSELGKFEQELTVLAGRNNTELESVTSLSASMTKKLAMKLSYTILHNSQVPANKKRTDTFTSVNLVYQFE